MVSLRFVAAGLLLLATMASSARDLTLSLTKINQTASPLAKCIDGTPPGYYWRGGVEEGVDKAVLFLEGGGWCYPSDVQQSSGANCAHRAKSPLGSSSAFPPTIKSMGYEGISYCATHPCNPPTS